MAWKIIPGLLALLFGLMGLNALFDPMTAADQIAVSPIGTDGLNTLRGDIAGLFLSCAALLILGVYRREPQWFLAVAVLMSIIAFGRLLGFIVDGQPSQNTIIAFTVEIMTAAAMVYSSRQLRAANADA